MQREEEIKNIAYFLWQAENCGHGHDLEHWLKAEAIWEEQRKTGQAASQAHDSQAAPLPPTRSRTGKSTRSSPQKG